MVFKQIYKTDTLTQEPVPLTQTKVQRQKISLLETATAKVDLTRVDLCFQDRFLNKNLTGPRIEGIVVYIRPATEETTELANAKNIEYYEFNGKTVCELKNIVIASGCIPRIAEQPTESSYLYLFAQNNANKAIYHKIKETLENIN
jgi:hypothetical protein